LKGFFLAGFYFILDFEILDRDAGCVNSLSLGFNWKNPLGKSGILSREVVARREERSEKGRLKAEWESGFGFGLRVGLGLKREVSLGL
jgi:hypothetical protein